MTRAGYWIAQREQRRLHRRARAAQQADHAEVCGILRRAPTRELRLEFLPNLAIRPGQWAIERSRLTTTDGESKVVGTFHSHPISEAVPGRRDRQVMRVGDLQLIYDVCGREARLWKCSRRKGRRCIVEVPLVVIGG